MPTIRVFRGWWVPVVFASGCLLPSFENTSQPMLGGEGGASDDGGAPAGSGAEAGASAGGAGSVGATGAPKPADDLYILQEGKSLSVGVGAGVLANDLPVGLSVTDFDDADPGRAASFDAELELAADGSLSFKPAPGFFGRYRVMYTVENALQESATAFVTFLVQPVSGSLDAVNQGIGGVALRGSPKEALGTSLVALGDVNADGFADFAVGAPGALADAGAVYVVFGNADFAGLTLAPLTNASADVGYAVLEGFAAAPVGEAVASAGDFNADAVPDLVLGSPLAGDFDDGRLFVVFGGKDLTGRLALDTLPAARGIVISGTEFGGQRLGFLVAGNGDLNGDDRADLLVGIYESGATVGGVSAIMENPDASSGIAELTERALLDMAGGLQQPGALTFAGDINGDGRGDLLASSDRHIALVLGRADGSLPPMVDDVSADGTAWGFLRVRAAGAPVVAPVAAAGDVNGDALDDFAYCDQLGGKPECVVLLGPREPQTSLNSGGWRLSGFAGAPGLPYLARAADLNQDDLSDLVLADAGSAYVVFGRESGHEPVDVSKLGESGFKVLVSAGGELASVATVGDINGDGYGDFAVGEPTADSGDGRVYVVFGGPYSSDQR